MTVLYARNYICEKCKVNKHIGGKEDILPDGWLRIERQRRGIMDEPVVMCSLECAVMLLNDWVEIRAISRAGGRRHV